MGEIVEEWHIIALLGITIVVYAFVFIKEPKAKAESTDQMTTQLEETLELFAAEIEEENKQVLNHIIKMKQHHDQETAELKERIRSIEDRLSAVQTVQEEVSETEPERVQHLKQEKSETIKQRYEQLFALYDEGKSIEAISKKIGIPKGEVQLILKLAQQEEAYHA